MRYSEMLPYRGLLHLDEKEASHRQLKKLGQHIVLHVIKRM